MEKNVFKMIQNKKLSNNQFKFINKANKISNKSIMIKKLRSNHLK